MFPCGQQKMQNCFSIVLLALLQLFKSKILHVPQSNLKVLYCIKRSRVCECSIHYPYSSPASTDKYTLNQLSKLLYQRQDFFNNKRENRHFQNVVS